MNSRISVDFAGESNTPIIKLNYRASDDVRDKLVQRFRENIGYESKTLCIELIQENRVGDGADYEIYPIKDELEYFKKRFINESSIKLGELSDWINSVIADRHN